MEELTNANDPATGLLFLFIGAGTGDGAFTVFPLTPAAGLGNPDVELIAGKPAILST